MGQSLTQNYLHVIFSTKHRQKLILPEFEKELFQYLGGTCKALSCHPLMVGGYLDHVHILCMLSKKVALVDLMQSLKASSSKWMKARDASLSNFYWQDGYGAFSVSPDRVVRVSTYIQNQRMHHQKKTFQEEYREFLEEHKVEYDERYVWD